MKAYNRQTDYKRSAHLEQLIEAAEGGFYAGVALCLQSLILHNKFGTKRLDEFIHNTEILANMRPHFEITDAIKWQKQKYNIDVHKIKPQIFARNETARERRERYARRTR